MGTAGALQWLAGCTTVSSTLPSSATLPPRATEEPTSTTIPRPSATPTPEPTHTPIPDVPLFDEGELVNTGRDLDLAIEGDGFFQITMPGGDTRYTRDGSFRLNSDGQMVNASGYYLDPSVTIPSDTLKVNIGSDGTVSVLQPGASAPTSVGNITLARFPNPAGLSSEGRNLYSETAASGTATVGTPGASGCGTLQQKFLEKSNVQMVQELVSLIVAQRAYEINARAIRAGDEMLQATSRVLG